MPKYKIKWVAPDGKLTIVELPTIEAKNQSQALKIARKRTNSKAVLSIKRMKKLKGRKR